MPPTTRVQQGRGRGAIWRGVLVACALCAHAAGVALAAERPEVTGARLYVSHQRIVSDLDCAHLFSEQIVGTVESGLPAVVELAWRLVDDDGDDVRRGVQAFGLRYDVWDDVYSLERGDTTFAFTSFDALRGAVEHLQRVPVVAVHDIRAGGVYAVEFAVAVHPLRGSEQQRIVGWVDDTVRGSDASWREQLLNVNDLIHRFFSRDRDASNQSDWFRSILFTPASLPSERRDQGGR